MPIQYRSDALHRQLQSLHRSAPDIRGSAIITHDGLVIAAYPPGWDGDIHDPTGGEHVAAMAAVLTGAAERTIKRLEQGQLERILIEGELGIVAVVPVTTDSALALLITKDAKLGLTLHAARQTARDIHAVLEQSRR